MMNETERTTKEAILQEALRLFSEKGYHGVSMREIAAAAGIKGASIYNHYEGKEQLLYAIFDEMVLRYEQAAQRLNVPLQRDKDSLDIYLQVKEEDLRQMARKMFLFLTEDTFTVMSRKLLVSEQFAVKTAGEKYRGYYLLGAMNADAALFTAMKQKGAFPQGDAQVMALQFYSPLLFLIQCSDNGMERETCLQQLDSHIHWFCRCYA